MSSYLCSSLLLLTVCTFLATRGDDVFASSAHTKMLFRFENAMLLRAENYLQQEEQRLLSLKRKVTEIREAREEDVCMKTEHCMESPLQTLQHAQRFRNHWNRVHTLVSNSKNSEDFAKYWAGFSNYLPNNSDMNSLKLAIAQLQWTYHLPIEEIANGLMNGKQSEPLSQRTLVDLGLNAVEHYYLESALSWMLTALQHNVAPLHKPYSDMLFIVGKIHIMRDNYTEGLEFIKQAIMENPSRKDYLENIAVNEDWNGKKVWQYNIDPEEVNKLCRAATRPVSVNKHGFHCMLKKNERIPYMLMKMEILNQSPEVFLFHDFISDTEAHLLQNLSLFEMNRAKVGIGKDARVSKIRFGKIAWLFDHIAPEFNLKMDRRISDATGLSVYGSSAEFLQISNYGVGGFYNAHYDFDPYANSSLFRISGDRIATFMIYLNNVDLGGATVFPLLKLVSKPVKNAAIFWYNYKHSGEGDTRTLHSACPVLAGEKWVANKWIHEFGQEFRRPCNLQM